MDFLGLLAVALRENQGNKNYETGKRHTYGHKYKQVDECLVLKLTPTQKILFSLEILKTRDDPIICDLQASF